MGVGIIIAGPTGIGKTDLALKLAKKFVTGSEIISIDSVQIYQKINIGSNKHIAKPGDPVHHLIDDLSVLEKSSVSKFTFKFKQIFERVILDDKVPIIVGGSSFYLDWILNGEPCSPFVPSEIQEMAEFIYGEDGCLDHLPHMGYDYNHRLHRNDLYRLKKDLEVFLLCGKPLSSFQQRRSILPMNTKMYLFYLTGSRYDLYRKVDHRCEIMIKNGLILEVRKLLTDGEISTGSNAGRSIGYRETIDFLQKIHKDTINFNSHFRDYLSEFQCHTHELIRKQESWVLNKLKEFIFIERKDLDSMAELEEIAIKIFDSICSQECWNILYCESGKLRELRRKSGLKGLMKSYQKVNWIYNDEDEIEKIKNILY